LPLLDLLGTSVNKDKRKGRSIDKEPGPL
jgi:hypothetical protein